MQWAGREAVFGDAEAEFAVTAEPVTFKEQIDFLRQKRPKPSKRWQDVLKGDHDRAFVVAAVTDIELLEGIQQALIDSRENGTGLKDFTARIDELAAKHGWDIPGDRDWRIRAIFETNMRTSFMAGRLRQMRDPDVVKMRPYWQYIHGDTRIPTSPRPQHLGWNGLVLMWDDPWWDIHFPPNDWMCSCGVRTLSKRDLTRIGKTGPDTAPPQGFEYKQVKGVGAVNQPAGIGYGWDYVPGDLWERGLVPSALIEEGGGLVHSARHAVQIDTPLPLVDLLAKARPFVAKPLVEGLSIEDYARGFLKPFGADIERAVLWTDATGTRLPISEALFQDRSGAWKIEKRGRALLTPLMAETLIDPDEIWIGLAAKTDPARSDLNELVVDRRYVRVDPDNGLLVVFEIGRKWWEAVTAYSPTKKNGAFDLGLLDRRRGGKLLWSRIK